MPGKIKRRNKRRRGKGKNKDWQKYSQPIEDTIPELLTQQMLTELNIEFSKQHDLSGFTYDIVIPEKRILIEVDGDYWHGNPDLFPTNKQTNKQIRQRQRDTLKNKIALDYGFRMIRVWEKDIKDNYNETKSQLKEAIDNEEYIQVLHENTNKKYKQRIIRVRNIYKKKYLKQDKIELYNDITN